MKNIKPTLFRLASHKNTTIANLWGRERGGGGCWEVQSKRPFQAVAEPADGLRGGNMSLFISRGDKNWTKSFCNLAVTKKFPRMKISVITDISVFRFYGYIGYIGDILDISEIYRWIFWKKISVSLKLLKTHENVRKTS